MNNETLTNFIRRKELLTEISVKRQYFIHLNKKIQLIEDEKINLLSEIQSLMQSHNIIADKLLEQEYEALSKSNL